VCTLIPLVVFSSPIYVDYNNCIITVSWPMPVRKVYIVQSYMVTGAAPSSPLWRQITQTTRSRPWFPTIFGCLSQTKAQLYEILETSTDMRTAGSKRYTFIRVIEGTGVNGCRLPEEVLSSFTRTDLQFLRGEVLFSAKHKTVGQELCNNTTPGLH